MGKYYLISFTTRRTGEGDKFSYNQLIDEDPLHWIVRVKLYQGIQYTLLSYYEISEEQYRKYEGPINHGLQLVGEDK